MRHSALLPMRRTTSRDLAPAYGLRVPAQDVLLYLELGWVLADEPLCGDVKMIPPTSTRPNISNGGGSP